MGRNRGFTEEDAKYLESLPGAKVTRVNIQGFEASQAKPSKAPFKPVAMKDANARKWDSKTEARFSFVLEDLKDEGLILRWEYNTRKYRLADRTWYKPDFHLLLPDFRQAIVEVKGSYVTDKAKERVKVLADMVPEPFFLAQWMPGWRITRLASRASADNQIPDIFRGVSA